MGQLGGMTARGAPRLSARREVITTFTASGTWSKKPGLLWIEVEVQGGGGSSSYVSHYPSSDNTGAGGGGAYSRKAIPAAKLSAQETVTVGGASGTSSFGAHCSATGGGGGGDGGAGGGGTASGGDVNINGQAGWQPQPTDKGVGGDSVLSPNGKGGNSSVSGVVTTQGGGAGIVIVREFYSV